MSDDEHLGGENSPALVHQGAQDESAAPAPAYRVLARKYRPQNFDQLIGQDVMVRILSNAFDLNRIHQAYMLTGVRGVGKTTTARILARALNYETPAADGRPAINRPTIHMPTLGLHCQAIMESRHVDVIEIDAASHTSVDNIREIIEGVRYKPALARTKVYIIDEVHMLSKAAFNALLKTLEEPPEHVKFVFATTEIEKVPVTVRSRCLRFDLRRIEPPVMVRHLATICESETIAIERDALTLIARAAEGSVRDALSLLDQAIAQGGRQAQLSAADVAAMLGLADKGRIVALFEAVLSGEIARALEMAGALYRDGAEPAQILLELAEFSHLAMRAKIAPDSPFETLSEQEAQAVRRNGAALSLSILTQAWRILIQGVAEARESPKPLASVDMVLARLAYAADLPSPDEALRKLGFGAPVGVAPEGGSSQAMRGPQAQLANQTFAPARSAPQQSAPQGAPRAQLAARPATNTQPMAHFATFADVVAKAAAERDIQMKLRLERDVRLVRFAPGHVELSLAPGADSQTPQILMRRLQEWTGERWMVTLSREPGAPSISEVLAEKARAKERGVAAEPLVRAALEVFPGAEIFAIRTPDDDSCADGAVAFDGDIESGDD